jgi:hypothetical protein
MPFIEGNAPIAKCGYQLIHEGDDLFLLLFVQDAGELWPNELRENVKHELKTSGM